MARVRISIEVEGTSHTLSALVSALQAQVLDADLDIPDDSYEIVRFDVDPPQS